MHIAHDPLLGRVIDGRVPRVVIGDAEVGRQFVGVDRFGLVVHDAADEVMEGPLADVRNLLQPDLPVALNRARDPGLVSERRLPALRPAATSVSSISTTPSSVGPSNGSFAIAARIR